jgi:hypothetical protein
MPKVIGTRVKLQELVHLAACLICFQFCKKGIVFVIRIVLAEVFGMFQNLFVDQPWAVRVLLVLSGFVRAHSRVRC